MKKLVLFIVCVYALTSCINREVPEQKIAYDNIWINQIISMDSNDGSYKLKCASETHDTVVLTTTKEIFDQIIDTKKNLELYQEYSESWCNVYYSHSYIIINYQLIEIDESCF